MKHLNDKEQGHTYLRFEAPQVKMGEIVIPQLPEQLRIQVD